MSLVAGVVDSLGTDGERKERESGTALTPGVAATRPGGRRRHPPGSGDGDGDDDADDDSGERGESPLSHESGAEGKTRSSLLLRADTAPAAAAGDKHRKIEYTSTHGTSSHVERSTACS